MGVTSSGVGIAAGIFYNQTFGSFIGMIIGFYIGGAVVGGIPNLRQLRSSRRI